MTVDKAGLAARATMVTRISRLESLLAAKSGGPTRLRGEVLPGG